MQYLALSAQFTGMHYWNAISQSFRHPQWNMSNYWLRSLWRFAKREAASVTRPAPSKGGFCKDGNQVDLPFWIRISAVLISSLGLTVQDTFQRASVTDVGFVEILLSFEIHGIQDSYYDYSISHSVQFVGQLLAINFSKFTLSTELIV